MSVCNINERLNHDLTTIIKAFVLVSADFVVIVSLFKLIGNEQSGKNRLSLKDQRVVSFGDWKKSDKKIQKETG